MAAISVWASRRFTNFGPIVFLLWRAPGLGPETRARVQKSFTRTLYHGGGKRLSFVRREVPEAVQP